MVKRYKGLTLTVKAFMIMAVLVVTVSVGWFLPYRYFAEMEESLNRIMDRDLEQLITSTRLVQQTEILISKGHMLAYAQDNHDRLKIQLEISDHAAWIKRMLDEMQEQNPAEYEQISRVAGILNKLEKNFSGMSNLVRERNASRDPAADESVLLEEDILSIIHENRDLATELSVILGYFTAAMRENLRVQNESLAAKIHRDQKVLLFLAAVFCVVLLGVGIYVRAGIVGRILKLRRGVRDKGEDASPGELRVGGNDEITRLSETISGYIQRIQNDRAELIRARKDAEAAVEIKSAFLANMSHEIRTPMNAVIGMTQIALKRTSQEQVRYYLTSIDTAARNLMRIINDILDFSKIEAGRLELESSCIRFRDVLRNVSSIHAGLIREKGLEMRIEVNQQVPEFFLGDPLRLEQVINNLVSNAVKFTEKGSVTLQADMVDRPSPALRCIVQDTGVGISSGQIPRLFEPFWQADISTTRTFGGTGLGLPICKELVELMGGGISAASTEGQGSTFEFFIPLETCQPEVVPDHPGVLADPDPSALAGYRVLVADDSPMNQEVARDMLTSLGILVETANNGQEAVDRVRDEEFDLVLMDVQMPVMDGLTATRRIREMTSDEYAGVEYRLPIIAMTAHAMVEDREKCLQAGMDDYLSKPFVQSEMQEILLRRLPGVRKPAAGSGPVYGRILAADDKRSNRELVREILVSAGYELVLVSNGAQALEAFQKQSFDLVLLDLRMPHLDGLQTIREIRKKEHRQGLRAVPAVAVSADMDKVTRHSCMQAGFTAVLEKPVGENDLKSVLADWLAKPSEGEGGSEETAKVGQPCSRLSLRGRTRQDMGQDSARLARYQDMLAEDIAEDMQLVQRSFERRDYPALIQAAHSLKGLCSQLEETSAHELAAALQAEAEALINRQSTSDRLKELLEQLNSLLFCLRSNDKP